MAQKSTFTLRDAVILAVVVAAGLLFYRMVANMETMTSVMVGMQKDISGMNTEISSMNREIIEMRKSMQSMDENIGRWSKSMGMGQAVPQMDNFNPMNMMRQSN